MTTTGYSTAATGRIWWQSTDPGTEATPLVILHGGPGVPSYYLEPLNALADERRVVLYDQVGAGRSDHPEDPAVFSVETFVEDLNSLVDDLGLATFHLLGHSWGGMLALAFSKKYAQRVASLVLASPLVNVEAWCADAAALVAGLPAADRQALSGPTEGPEYKAAEAEFYRRHFCNLNPWPEPLQHSFDELGMGPYLTMWGPNEFTQTGNLRGRDYTPVVRSLEIPNLWLCGSDDEARPDTIGAFARMNPEGEYLEFAGGTHSVHLEQPDAYIAAVRGFLARH
ncbi:hypothetical protein BKD30_08680 [Tersicoccus phoenicis]|uniref:Proline iminopeptidase n=1 Tax=Tersicoccus phoenicis TaxID=554083 RepID=A0A1R1LA34_9MICC|nr:proline iminopeptidase-family hydrolase [Tersicoccus phoenicis]OMH24380.1 hypothetical protein BKD30_08680 [Tersicoccus phoenicis]